MSYQPSTNKRRRLNDPATVVAASTLSKPFKSPLRASIEKANQGRRSSLLSGPAGFPNNDNDGNDDDDDAGGGDTDVVLVKSKTTSSPPRSPAQETTPSPAKKTHYSKQQPSSSPSKPNPRVGASTVSRLSKPFTSPRKKSLPPLFPSSASATASTGPASSGGADAASRARIANLHSEIDTLTQAVRILSSNRPAELSKLIATWRRVAREAADEVFASAKDRVNRMGGVGAWRDMEKVKQARQKQWDDEAREAEQQKRKEELTREIVKAAKAAKAGSAPAVLAPRNDDSRSQSARLREADGNQSAEDDEEEEGEESEDDEETEAAAQKEAEKRIIEEQQRQHDDDDGEEESNPTVASSTRKEQEAAAAAVAAAVVGDDDEFTMDMMLRTLNVELDVIGFDKAMQRWVD